MKVKFVPTLIAAGISALVAYALYSVCKLEDAKMILAIGGFVCLFFPLATCLGVRFEQGRTSANTAVLGGVFFFILLVSHFIFAFTVFRTPAYLIINGIILLIFILVAYAVAKAKQ